MLATHHAAVKARLGGHSVLTGKVVDAVRDTAGSTEPRSNFVGVATTLVGFDPGENSARLSAAQSPTGDVPLMIRVRYAAVDYAGLLVLLDAGNAQLVGHRLEVAGRAVGPLECEIDEPRFDRVARMHYVDAYYEATTSRAV